MTCGIYVIVAPNANVYVGSSRDVTARFRTHRWELRRGDHHCVALQRAWNKYGEDQMKFLVIERCEIAQLICREQFWIDYHHVVFKRLYNSSRLAGRVERSPDVTEKIRKANIGRKPSEETRRRMSEAGRNRPPISDATRAKLTGRKLDPDVAAKRGAARKGTKHRMSEAGLANLRDSAAKARAARRAKRGQTV